MHWQDFDLFLFDLDGLLVDTEALHHEAYITMCEQRGFKLPWSFPEYFAIAQSGSDSIQKALLHTLPALHQQEPSWDLLYNEKKQAFLKILKQKAAPLLPGVQELLHLLEKTDKKRAVVTHSAKELTTLLQMKEPILHSIPHWFTREDYSLPKPSPDGYLKAIQTLANPHDRIIGFEDSLRGMQALMQTKAFPVYVNNTDRAAATHFQQLGIKTLTSLEELL